MKILEIDASTGVEIIRDATESEIAQAVIDEKEFLAKQSKAKKDEQAKTALLERLGITADEAALLLK